MRYHQGENRQFPQILIIITGSLIGLNNGILYAWTSPSIPKLLADDTMGITIEEASYLVILPYLAMIFGAPLFSFLMNRIGRKLSLLILAIPHILAWIVTGFAYDIVSLYAARLLTGVADVATYSIIPVYIGEITEPSIRSTWGNLFTISLYVGKFVINILGSYTSIQETALICGCIPLLYLACSTIMPESPYFLLMKGKEEEAKKVLQKLRWRSDVEDEMQSIKAYVKRDSSEVGTLKDIFKVKSNRKALLTCIGIRVAQLYTGLICFETYTQYMFQEAGGFLSPQVSAILLTGIFIPAICFSTLLTNKFGRRPLMIFSSLGCAVALTIESIYFCIKHFTQINLDHLNWVPIAGMFVFIVMCAAGLAFLPILMWSELLPASVKGKATTIIILNQGLHCLIAPKLFQTLIYNFGIHAPFLFFTGCTYVSALIGYLYLIETKGKSLEEIQEYLSVEKY